MEDKSSRLEFVPLSTYMYLGKYLPLSLYLEGHWCRLHLIYNSSFATKTTFDSETVHYFESQITICRYIP